MRTAPVLPGAVEQRTGFLTNHPDTVIYSSLRWLPAAGPLFASGGEEKTRMTSIPKPTGHPSQTPFPKSLTCVRGEPSLR